MNRAQQVSAKTPRPWWRAGLALTFSLVVGLLIELILSSARAQQFSLAPALPDLSFFAFVGALSWLWSCLRRHWRRWTGMVRKDDGAVDRAP